MQDVQLADVAGVEQGGTATAGWTGSDWTCRATTPVTGTVPRGGQGAGARELLSGYYHAVHKLTLEYVAGVTADELARIVDTNWDPPVTASARLVSIIDDCAPSTSGRPHTCGAFE